jgi:hypothetical protein
MGINTCHVGITFILVYLCVRMIQDHEKDESIPSQSETPDDLDYSLINIILVRDIYVHKIDLEKKIIHFRNGRGFIYGPIKIQVSKHDKVYRVLDRFHVTGISQLRSNLYA